MVLTLLVTASVFSLFFSLDPHFGAENTWESNLAELLQVSAKFYAFCVFTSVRSHLFIDFLQILILLKH